MNFDELEGSGLDGRVLEAIGLEVTGDGAVFVGRIGKNPVAIVGDPAISPFLRSPSREWSVAGPLIEANRMSIFLEKGIWYAACGNFFAVGPTLLVAAMRALCVAGQGGEEIKAGSGTIAEAMTNLGRVQGKKPPDPGE